MAKQRLTLQAMSGMSGMCTWEVDASVIGGLAIHERIDVPKVYTLTVVACGLALTHSTKPMLQQVRKALLATDVPWLEITSKRVGAQYRDKIVGVLSQFKSRR